MCQESLNYCRKNTSHSIREDSGYSGDICPQCFQELEEKVLKLEKKILQLDEEIYFLKKP